MKNISFMALLSVCLAFGRAAHAQDLPPDVAQSLAWLPPQSETLAVARGPLTIQKAAPKGAKPRNVPVEKPSSHFLLSNLQLGIIVPNLIGRTIESSLEARSNFRPPAGLGLMPYDGCGVVRLRPLAGETAKSLQTKLSRGATRGATIAGQEVGVFEQKRINDVWRIYVAVPRPNLVLLATTHAQLETVLTRMNGKAVGPRAFPADWSGWKLVNTSAPFWAIRRLDLKQSVGIFLGQGDKDAQASAFSVEATGPTASALLLKYQSPNGDVAKRMFEAIKSELRAGVTMRKVAPDMTVISVSGQNSGLADFYVMGFLGTAVFL